MRASPDGRYATSRRTLLKGVAAGAGAAALSTGPFVHLGRAQSEFAGTTVTWMSNQRHDRAIKEMLFAEFAEQSGITVEMQIFADEYQNQLKLAMEAGNAPDMFNLTPRSEIEAGWPSRWTKTWPPRRAWKSRSYRAPSRPFAASGTARSTACRCTPRRCGSSTTRRSSRTPASIPRRRPKRGPISAPPPKQISDNLGGDGVFGLILGDKFTWVWWMNAAIPAMGAGSYFYNWQEGRYSFNQDGIKQAIE